jgi:hypothetical protein
VKFGSGSLSLGMRQPTTRAFYSLRHCYDVITAKTMTLLICDIEYLLIEIMPPMRSPQESNVGDY